ncbi:MAG: signal peptide peptidase SppA [Lachnospiraceae bacterium]|nr:signal peptide peptidase SppA [Lachnospiraceae bacterium]
MNKKQTNGLIVAAIIFAVVGITSVLTNALSSRIATKQNAVAKDGFSSFMDELYGSKDTALADMPTTGDFIAVMNIEGTIQGSVSTGSLYGDVNSYDHDLLMSYVNKLIDRSNNKGIILRMDTPGGTVYHADELYLKLKEYKEKTGNPIWVYMESQCCSGGVYIASVADEQYANRICNTGSIGVILSAYDMSELYEKLGIKEVNIVSAKNKDMGSSGKPMTDEQKAIYQSIVDEYYERFISIVAEGRNMSTDEVKKLADGRIYTAKQAEESGLIDGIKGSEEFDQYVKEVSGVDRFYQPSRTVNYFSQIFGSIASAKEKSESEVLVDLMKQLGSGVPMYYAKPIGE